MVSVHDVQQADDLPYIVQEYIDGSNLPDWATKTKLSYRTIVDTIIAITEAVGYLHQHGLTHCDLKMENILMDNNDNPHVTDFGLALSERVQTLRKGEIFGTPAIMAPEQVRGETHQLDGRTDIWAIGAMLYELLVGRRGILDSYFAPL